jgi:hypothetical protein
MPSWGVHYKDHKDKKVFSVIRDPRYRIVTQFFRCKKRNKIMSQGDIYEQFDWFLDNLDSIEDIHVYPQADFITAIEDHVTLYPFEDYRFRKHENKTEDAKRAQVQEYVRRHEVCLKVARL